MKMGGDRVFKELREQVARHQQQHRGIEALFPAGTRLLPDHYGLWQDLKKGDCQHKPGTQREQVTQVPLVIAVELRREQDEPAEHVGKPRKYTEYQEL